MRHEDSKFSRLALVSVAVLAAFDQGGNRRISLTAHRDVNDTLKGSQPANSLDMTAIVH